MSKSKYRRESDRPLASMWYYHNLKLEKEKKAWQGINENLPANAFADDVTVEEVGTYNPLPTLIVGGYSSLGEYEKETQDFGR